MRDYFFETCEDAKQYIAADDKLLASFSGESTFFSRFNHAKIRQSGEVTQSYIKLRLIRDGKQAFRTTLLTGNTGTDRETIKSSLSVLGQIVDKVAPDPHLLVSDQVVNSDYVAPNRLPDSENTVESCLQSFKGLDAVGIYMSGTLRRGFWNSLGQRNWFETNSFNLDWSFYQTADKAIKQSYAGFEWEDEQFLDKVDHARKMLPTLGKAVKTIKPGMYPVYLGPAAVNEIMTLLCWGGFSLKAQKTQQSPLRKLTSGEASLSKDINLHENTRDGIAPNFDESGFVRPPQVTLIENGKHRASMTSARSAQEYSLPTNGAEDSESPQSMDMQPGKIPMSRSLNEMQEGVYVGNLWYLNFSDRNACRYTGMTRFATFWVENGEIKAPIQAMRFDDTFYNMFGSELAGLTSERELMISAETYGQRSVSCANLPGALINRLSFTL